MDLYRCYERIGNICKAEGKTESAEEWIEKSLALCESLISQNDSTAVRRSIADIYKKRGDICKKKGNPHEARAYYEEAFHIYEKLAKQTDFFDYLSPSLPHPSVQDPRGAGSPPSACASGLVPLCFVGPR